MKEKINLSELELTERVVNISRTAKVVKGGRRFSFSALVVVGDGQGHVGAGLGKAKEVPEAIRKAGEQARKDLIKIPLQGNSLPHEIIGRFGSARVMLKPASAGTGVIAGGAVRAVIEAAGVHNVLTKCIGTNNPHNVVKATFNGLTNMKVPEKYLALKKAV